MRKTRPTYPSFFYHFHISLLLLSYSVRVPCLFCFLLSLLYFLSYSIVLVTFVTAIRFLAML
jgi:hypothetical protein